MKKSIASVLIILLFTLKAFSQEKMIVNKLGGTTYFGSYYNDITSLNQLPPAIVTKVKSLIEIFLGDFSSKTHFVGGQVNDLKRYFADNNKINSSIPKYQLEFILKDASIGIKSLPIEIRLDESGKPLKITWPRKDYTNRSKFLERDTIKAFVLSQAAKFNFNQNYKVDFRYDENKQKFFWRFLFPVNNGNSTITEFNLIEINWADVNDFEISKIHRSIVY